MKRGLEIPAVVALIWFISTGSVTAVAQEGGREPSKVVSYFVPGQNGVEWRLFSPEDGKDELFQVLSTKPKHLFWHEESVFYSIGWTFYEASWEIGSTPKLVFLIPYDELPTARQIQADLWEMVWDQVWIDKETGKWRIGLVEHVSFSRDDIEKEEDSGKRFVRYKEEKLPLVGDGGEFAIVSIYEYDDPKWRLIAKTATAYNYWSSPMNALPEHKNRVPVTTLDNLGELTGLEEGFEMGGGRYYKPGIAEPSVYTTVLDYRLNVGIEYREDTGDIYSKPFFVAPIYYVDFETGEKEVLYSGDDGCSHQVRFSKYKTFLLIGAEYVGGCAIVVDLKMGEIIKSITDQYAFAVWVHDLR